ncbi:MAG: DegV family EDD domain-containing protein, partial [Anaeroplasmataceae bacterium]|nr:DegV family EDD domain-containing protein [Anaeroplasmataceae bacterium]
SKELSGTFSSLKIAIDELQEEFPERKIYTVDSKVISIGSYLLNRLVSNLYHQGKTAEEIVEYANRERDKVAMYLYSDDLKFFRRSGRVSNFSAFMGTILGIHPIIHLDSNGFMKALTKARGRLGSLNKILDFVSELEEDIADYPVIIGHADCEDLAHKLGELLEQRFGKLNIEYVIVNPTAGAHCGPNSMGIAFHAKHR